MHSEVKASLHVTLASMSVSTAGVSPLLLSKDEQLTAMCLLKTKLSALLVHYFLKFIYVVDEMEPVTFQLSI